MGRTAKNANLQNSHVVKDEMKVRQETEDMLKGEADKVKPPEHLTTEQRKLFKFIVDEYKAAGILGNLDLFVLETAVVAIDRMHSIEKIINENPDFLFDKNLTAAKNTYSRDFFKCCNELCLSPQARAKMGIMSLKQKKESEDPLLKILKKSDLA